MKILVTGANGYLGRHLVGELLARGHTVRAMVRPSGRPQDPLTRAAVEIFQTDLRDPPRLPEAFGGVDALAHLAAMVVGNPASQFRDTVVSTENILNAMARSKTRQLFLVSSFSVYDWKRSSGTLTENSPLEAELYDRDEYAAQKVWQERIARRFTAAHDWRTTIVRPGYIWGAGKALVPGTGQKIGPFQIIFGPLGCLPLTHVENCAHACAEAIVHPRAVGEVFNIVDSYRVPTWKYVGRYFEGLEEKGIRIPVPYRLGYALVRLADRVSKIIFNGKGKLPSLLVPCRYEARFKTMYFSNEKIRTVLNWNQPLDFEGCVQKTYGPVNRPSPAASEGKPVRELGVQKIPKEENSPW